MKKTHHISIISFLIAGLTLYFTFKNITLAQIRTSLFNVNYYYLIFASLLVILTFYIRAIRWKYLIRPIKKVSPGEILPPLMIGYMGNLLPARIGEFIRAFLLGKKLRISFSSAFATIFVERIFDLFVLVLLLAWLLLFKSDLFAHMEIFGNSLESTFSSFGLGSLAFCFFLILFCYLIIHATEKIIKLIDFLMSPLPDRWRLKCLKLIRSFKEGLGILTDYRSISIVFLFTLLEWFVIIISNYPIFMAFNIQFLPYSALITVTVFLGTFTTLFPTPGYIGAFQLACVIALYKIYGVSEATAVSFGILYWLINIGIVVVSGSYFLVKEKISIMDLREQGESI